MSNQNPAQERSAEQIVAGIATGGGRERPRIQPRSERFGAVLDTISDPLRRARLKMVIDGSPDDRSAAEVGGRLLGEDRKRMADRLVSIEAELRQKKLDHDWVERLDMALTEIMPWSNSPYRLGAVDGSVFHKVLSAPPLTCASVLHYREPDIDAARDAGCSVFLVQHDWAAALANATVDDGAFRLPFDYCCFEFSVSGRRICLLVVSENGEPRSAMPIVQTTAGWLVAAKYNGLTLESAGEEEPAFRGFVSRLFAQVRAIAITLDAEVVTAELVRAPHRLNQSRLKNGHPPIYDHHVLSLARKTHTAPLERHGEPTSFHKRLHFRRGHWRHYANHKTWIRWMLVGDPSLGFADKDYRL